MPSLKQQLAGAKAEEDKADKLNRIIDQAADDLVNGSPERCAKSLEDLAVECKASQELFEQMRRLAITKAISQSSQVFIMEKLKIAEEDMRDARRNARRGS